MQEAKSSHILVCTLQSRVVGQALGQGARVYLGSNWSSPPGHINIGMLWGADLRGPELAQREMCPLAWRKEILLSWCPPTEESQVKLGLGPELGGRAGESKLILVLRGGPM